MTLKAHGTTGALCRSSATVLLLTLACGGSEEGAGADTMALGTDAPTPGASGPNGDNSGDSTTPSPNATAPSNESSSPAAPVPPPPGPSAEPVDGDDTSGPAAGGANGVNPEPEVSDGEGGEATEPAPAPSEEMEPPAPIDEPVVEDPSAGCTANASPAVGAQTLDVDGTERSYIVSLPEDYDPTMPYPLIFAFHGLGGSAELVSGRFYFGLEEPGGRPTVFVYPDGLDTGMGSGWANTDGQDVAFFDLLLTTLQQNYCIDSARVFSTGHSYGGMMTHTLACQRAEVLRAVAPVAGAFFGGGGGGCSGPVAAWGAHGDPDNTVDYESGLSAIERLMETNGCDPASGTPVEPSEYCTAYECDSDYPVTWCPHDQDHDWPDFAAESIKGFFDSF